MVHIRANNVSYSYPVLEHIRSLKNHMMRTLVGGSIRKDGRKTMVQALDDVSFELEPGDRFGLLGRNGSGKTTMLRLLAGLITPDSGALDIDGRVLSLITRGTGINEELTGAANLELPLRILGATDAEVAEARQRIPEFIELGQFLDLPVRTYSEGMKARLSFGISTFLRRDIILLDEWIATGDQEFVAKANGRMAEMVADTGILVVATHSTELVRAVCNKVAIMDSGRIVFIGGVDEALATYAPEPETD